MNNIILNYVALSISLIFKLKLNHSFESSMNSPTIIKEDTINFRGWALGRSLRGKSKVENDETHCSCTMYEYVS